MFELRTRCWLPFLGSLLLITGSACAQAESNYDRLTEPAVAAALKLTDAQKAQVTAAIAERDEALKVEGADATAIRAGHQAKLSAILTARQSQLFQALFSGTRLRFNFRAQKWEQVLKYIADEADLSLVMNEAPPGVFNYSDSKEYTPTEAIDLINGWLLTKGYTLVRRERLLMCLSLKDGVPANSVPRVTPEELATRGRFELVTTLIPLEGRPIDAVVKELEAIKGTYGKITPLASTGQVLITDTAGSIKAMQPIIKAIPIPAPPAPKPKPKPKPPAPKPPAPVIQVHAIKHANPEQAGEVLRKFISGTILVDAQANQITISAPPAVQEMAKSIIARLEQNQGPDKQPTLKLYPVRTRDVDELIATIELAAPAAKVRMEDRNRTLVAWATPKEHAQVSNVLDQLSLKGQQTTGTQLETYTVERVSPSAALALLQELLPDARMTANDDSDSLIVVGSLADHQAVRSLIEQIDAGKKKSRELKTYAVAGIAPATVTALAASFAPTATVTFDATSENAMVLAKSEEHERIGQLIDQLRTSAAKLESEVRTYPTTDIDVTSVTSLLTTVTPNAIVTADTTNRRLVVIASAIDQKKVQNVLEQVQKTPAALRQLKPYVLPEGQTAESATSLLATLVPSAAVTPDTANGRLLIVANADDHKVVGETLTQLGDDAGKKNRELKTYAVAGIAPATVTELAASFAPTATVTFDATSENAMVLAKSEEHERIGQLIDQLRTSAAKLESDVRTYPTADIDVTSVTSLLATVVPNAIVTADTTNRRLVVIASAIDQKKVQNVLEQIQKAPTAVRHLKPYVLPEGQTSETVTTLLATLVPNAAVTADTTNGRLLIVANADDHKLVGETLTQLGDGRDIPELRFYPVAEEVVAGVEPVLTSVAPSATITVDVAARRVSAVASKADHDRIKTTLDKLLLAATADEKPGMKIYQVTSEQRRRFTSLAANLTTQLPGLEVIPGNEPREVTVWAKPSQQEIVAGILEQLKRNVPVESKPALSVYPITKVDAASVQTVLVELFPDVKVTLDEKASRLLINALPEEHKAIDAAIRQLDTDTPVATDIKLMSYPVDGLTSATVVSTLTAEVPGATIIPDTVAKTVIVRGRMKEHREVAAII